MMHALAKFSTSCPILGYQKYLIKFVIWYHSKVYQSLEWCAGIQVEGKGRGQSLIGDVQQGDGKRIGDNLKMTHQRNEFYISLHL